MELNSVSKYWVFIRGWAAFPLGYSGVFGGEEILTHNNQATLVVFTQCLYLALSSGSALVCLSLIWLGLALSPRTSDVWRPVL